jgi:hypothetical protein
MLHGTVLETRSRHIFRVPRFEKQVQTTCAGTGNLNTQRSDKFHTKLTGVVFESSVA